MEAGGMLWSWERSAHSVLHGGSLHKGSQIRQPIVPFSSWCDAYCRQLLTFRRSGPQVG